MNEHNDPPEEKKSDRQRKKRFYNTIRQQIEFYLGNVNLSKDRFFSNLLHRSPYIDIDVMLNCNKLRKLTTDPKDIVKALKKSEFLSVTEDKTKIFRTVPIAPVSDADPCTIYVEDLPQEVDHEWLKSVFTKYGDVAYVSIPHYKTNRKIKGFAFIQFESSDSADRALMAFRSVNSCLSSTMEPETLLSIRTFEGEKDKVVISSNEIRVDQIKCLNMDQDEEIDTTTENVEDQPSEIDNEDEPQRKKRKTKLVEEDPESANNSAQSKTEKVPKVKGKASKEKTEVLQEDATMKSASENEKSKSEGETEFDTENSKRKRKRKKAKPDQVQTYGMQILSKHDWKKLRNKYLEEQRKRMHELKQLLKKTALNPCEKKSEENSEEENSDMKTEDEVKVSECRVTFTPGVIIKLQLDKPIKNVKHFKNEVKRFANVEYIDARENSNLSYFRCTSNEIANQVIGLNKWPNMAILLGDEEQAYWEKIKNDRKEKFEQKIKCPTRGKNKLMKKVEAAMLTSHIRFSE